MISPASRARASWSPTADWTRRRSGRAPYTGSNPVSASHSLAAGDTVSVSRRPASRAASPAICRSTIWRQLAGGQRVEHDHVVQPVQELRLERVADRGHDRVPLGRLVAERRVGDELGPQVRGEDQDGVPEVHRPALAVGQPPVVEHLEQDVEDLRMGLLHLVEQYHGVRPPAHRLGELAAFLVADVAGRGADQPGHRVLLAVLAHVDPDHGPLVVEQELRQRLGQLGLAHAGRPQEQERAGGPVRVGHARPGPADRVGDRLHGPALPDHPPADLVLHPQQLGRLAFEQPAGRDAGPGGHHVSHVVRADLLLHHRRRSGDPARRFFFGRTGRGARRRSTSALTVGISPYSSRDAAS